MATGVPRESSSAATGLFWRGERPDWLRQADLAELERTLRSAIMCTAAYADPPVLIASVQRGDGYGAVALGGPVDRPAVRALAAQLRGLLDTGVNHLVVDLSNTGQLDEGLAGLLRTAEARLAALGGVFELAGLSPRTLHGLDDDLLTRVFAVYRAALEDASPRQLSWAALRCPHGLDDVAEPHTAARHRSVIDTGSGLARSER
jgi:hypothetical protein